MKYLTSITTVFTVLTLTISLGLAVPNKAHAQSLASLNPLLETLEQEMQEFQHLLAANPQATPTVDGCVVPFERNLAFGSTGPAVHQLQEFLNAVPSAQVAATGPGSPGQETNYFGPHTRQAVMEFQESYSFNILTPLSLEEPTGFWGPQTRQQANAICTQRTV